MSDIFTIKEIKKENKQYPQLLREVSGSPEKIYIRGSLNPKAKYLAVIGSRKCSKRGKIITSKIVEKLLEYDINIVSGLAHGIDTEAHKKVVEKKKKTIAVLGTGVDEKSLYPQSNLLLSRKIIQSGGCLMSEVLPGNRGSRSTFPRRNRIISGISLATLVIESEIKSGSLITANFAFSQNRKVFAIPGSPGNDYIIKKGGKMIKKIEDILKEII